MVSTANMAQATTEPSSPTAEETNQDLGAGDRCDLSGVEVPGTERVHDDGSLTVFSKKSKRLHKKLQLRRGKHRDNPNITLLDLPFDIAIEILSYLRPSDVFRLSRTCRYLHGLWLQEHSARIARSIIKWRYSCLEKCMRLPVLVRDIGDDTYLDALLNQERLRGHDIRRRPYYQHIKAPDPNVVCTCLTCVLRWNVLCLAVDFAQWQDNLDTNEPLPVIPRGRQPEWNTSLLEAHAAVVLKAMPTRDSGGCSALWHAAILEAHLDSTVRSIRRHGANKFNQRARFRMTADDAASGTDDFLQRRGPPSLDFPFHRDNYYMLEAYLPNRSWFPEEERWGYMPAEQHDKDLEQLRKWVSWRRSRAHGDAGGGAVADTLVMEFRGSRWRPVLDLRERHRQAAEEPVS